MMLLRWRKEGRARGKRLQHAVPGIIPARHDQATSHVLTLVCSLCGGGADGGGGQRVRGTRDDPAACEGMQQARSNEGEEF